MVCFTMYLFIFMFEYPLQTIANIKEERRNIPNFFGLAGSINFQETSLYYIKNLNNEQMISRKYNKLNLALVHIQILYKK